MTNQLSLGLGFEDMRIDPLPERLVTPWYVLLMDGEYTYGPFVDVTGDDQIAWLESRWCTSKEKRLKIARKPVLDYIQPARCNELQFLYDGRMVQRLFVNSPDYLTWHLWRPSKHRSTNFIDRVIVDARRRSYEEARYNQNHLQEYKSIVKGTWKREDWLTSRQRQHEKETNAIKA